MKQAIKAEARRLGFEWVGVTTPEPPAHLNVYRNWLADGRHGEMAYLAKERARRRRTDPRQILPECQSILALGVRYPAQPPTDATTDIQGVESLHGRVASYAWSDDYHDVLPVRLRELAKYIEKLNGAPVPNRWYTDTGPLLEREFAQRAGLGWIGKNTCLINPGHGSYFLLAEILLGIDLPPDPPFTADRCGECRRCLEACPTGCILSDRTIDSRRCISYLTIELKGPIPVDLRLMIGDWIFGCDICQQVCPWNQRFARALGDPAFAALPGRARPELVNELNLTAEEFNLKFKGSPIKRAKRRGYLRNVAVALGNSMDRTASAALSNAMLYDPEPLVRGHAAWALGRIGGEAARQALNLAIQNEPDAYVQGEIEAASGYQD
jgi:epoxyqueuosine reductase